MPRRTKEEAQETRNRILDAAEALFHAHGVSRTSLADIAHVAGVTRGAVYWHFENKADLFEAMIDRVELPIEVSAAHEHGDALSDPIRYLRAFMRAVLHRAANDPQARRVFEIVSHKVEYVDEMSSARERHFDGMRECQSHVSVALEHARRAGAIGKRVNTRSAAIGLHALMDGLIRSWMLAPDSFDLELEGAVALDTFLAGLGAEVRPPVRQVDVRP